MQLSASELSAPFEFHCLFGCSCKLELDELELKLEEEGDELGWN